jgi:hypothetical protein
VPVHECLGLDGVTKLFQNELSPLVLFVPGRIAGLDAGGQLWNVLPEMALGQAGERPEADAGLDEVVVQARLEHLLGGQRGFLLEGRGLAVPHIKSISIIQDLHLLDDLPGLQPSARVLPLPEPLVGVSEYFRQPLRMTFCLYHHSVEVAADALDVQSQAVSSLLAEGVGVECVGLLLEG